MTAAASAPATRAGVVPAIVAGGLTAATCDFIAAMAIYHLPALTVGKAVARGWFGREKAMAGGLDVALIGIVSHYAILLAAAAIFVAASLRFPILRRRAVVAGIVFGLGIYVVMHFVVLPLSNAGRGQPQGLQLYEELAGHMLVIGLPIALWARKFLGTT
jgi:uncharacterized membrane protein YagU involved in acid resistance